MYLRKSLLERLNIFNGLKKSYKKYSTKSRATIKNLQKQVLHLRKKIMFWAEDRLKNLKIYQARY